MVDPRKIVGNTVQTLAKRVTHISECLRRFGSNAETKIVEGVIYRVERTRSALTNHTSTTIHANWVLDESTILSRGVLLRNVSYIAPILAPVPPAILNDHNAHAVAENPEILVEAINNTTENRVEVAERFPPPLFLPLRPPTPPGFAAPLPAQPLPVAEAQVDNIDAFGNVTTTAHEKNWYSNDILLTSAETELNGPVRHIRWHVKTPVGERIHYGDNAAGQHSRLDIFLMMFPPAQLTVMLQQTNQQLRLANNPEINKRELLKFFGVLLLITKYEFAGRSSLWSETASSKYEPAPNFGKTGMSRKRFDTIWQHLRFGEQPEVRPADMSHEAHRWMLVDNFIENYNHHRRFMFCPSEYICVDESMSRWYGLGGNWINLGLPMYVAIDRKPDNGCEIQTAACAKSGVMIRLRLVKSAAIEDNYEDVAGVGSGTQILKFLVEPWLRTHRVVCADSYFSSVSTAEVLLAQQTRFIGVVKTAHRKFPMPYLKAVVLPRRGMCKGLYSRAADGHTPQLMAFVWVDRERRYFISSCSNISDGLPYIRRRWRQVVHGADAEVTPITIKQPLAAEIYYGTCARVDQHNRDRQKTLGTERKVRTLDWAKRVGTTLLSMNVVDAWKVYSKASFYDANGEPTLNEDGTRHENQKEFYSALIVELIDNTCDMAIGAAIGALGTPRAVRHRAVDAAMIDENTGAPRSGNGNGAYLSPTKRKRIVRGVETNHAHQGYCRICRAKTRFQCNICKYSADIDDDGWLCHSDTTRDCFAQHCGQKHEGAY